MAKGTITIPLDPQTARAYESAAPERKRKMQALLSLWLRELAAGEYPSLQQVLDDVGRKAKERGLTPEMLDSLLKARSCAAFSTRTSWSAPYSCRIPSLANSRQNAVTVCPLRACSEISLRHFVRAFFPRLVMSQPCTATRSFTRCGSHNAHQSGAASCKTIETCRTSCSLNDIFWAGSYVHTA